MTSMLLGLLWETQYDERCFLVGAIMTRMGDPLLGNV